MNASSSSKSSTTSSPPTPTLPNQQPLLPLPLPPSPLLRPNPHPQPKNRAKEERDGASDEERGSIASERPSSSLVHPASLQAPAESPLLMPQQHYSTASLPNIRRLRLLSARSNKIDFHPSNHQYTVSGSPIKTSVSALVSSFFRGFSPKRVADAIVNGKDYLTGKYAGMSQEEICQQWRNTGLQAASAGTRLHQQIEFYTNGIDIEDPCEAFPLFHRFLDSRPSWVLLRSEMVVAVEEWGLAGMIDSVWLDTETGRDRYRGLQTE